METYIKRASYYVFLQLYAIHGAWWHNRFGHRARHGCINLPLSEAEWLYNWADIETRV